MSQTKLTVGQYNLLGNTCLFKKGKRKEQRQQYTYKLK